ncbi:MAG: cysteine desulfurase NifS [Clostridia bacterium]|nr:cysteine desulfurase NifS [Clostridia bacterium]
MKRFVYADNAATTATDARVVEAMLPYFTENFGNPSSVHAAGRQVAEAVKSARIDISNVLNCRPDEVYFTSGGTEADNWVIKGCVAHALMQHKTPHIISTVFEHHAVLHTLEKCGAEVTLLPVYENGIVHPDDLRKAMKENTVLVTVMFANNEIGTIQPIKELAAIAHEGGAVFHTDAVQAVGHLPIDVKDMGIDALSFSAHKFGGPKGIGGLYLKNGVRLPNLLTGGQQERGRRSGTENTPGIIGTAKALTLAAEEMQENIAKVTKLRDKLIDGMLQIPYARLNGDREQRLPGNVNISIPFIEGESLLLWLDVEGICASSGSACTSASLDPSHVLLSIGLPHEIAHGSLRFSLSHENTEEDIDYILEKLPPIVEKLRNMSPLWHEREQ